MRVIAGSKRRLLLKTVEGKGTRPTTDRIKETLFNILSDDVYDSRFLDLFAGSGQIGIEALSRGASSATFVENDRKAQAVIADNIAHTGFEEEATLIKRDCLLGLKTLSGNFDIVFMDPPYNQGLEKEVLKGLKEYNLVNEDSLIIVEADLRDESFDYFDELGFELIKTKEYKTNKHLFLRIK